MAPEPTSDQPADAGPGGRDGEPILPVRSLDDTDVGWGEHAPADDDERLRRDRPPHWDSLRAPAVR